MVQQKRDPEDLELLRAFLQDLGFDLFQADGAEPAGSRSLKTWGWALASVAPTSVTQETKGTVSHVLLVCEIGSLGELAWACAVMASVRPWLSQGMEDAGSVRKVTGAASIQMAGNDGGAPP